MAHKGRAGKAVELIGGRGRHHVGAEVQQHAPEVADEADNEDNAAERSAQGSPQPGATDFFVHRWHRFPRNYCRSTGEQTSGKQEQRRDDGQQEARSPDAAALPLAPAGVKQQVREEQPKRQQHHAALVAPPERPRAGQGEQQRRRVEQHALAGAQQQPVEPHG